jgi:RND superfamily putative drug exporter
MTVTDSHGRVLENVPFDSPIRLTPGARALVQMYGVHRGGNLTKGTTIIYSTRIEDASQPMFYLIGPRQGAAQFINLNGNADTAVISVVARTGQYADEHENFVYDLRNRIIPEIPGLSAYHVYVGGDAAAFIDFRDQLYGRFPIIIVLVMVLIFVILLMFFQSIWLPIKAMLLSLLSILATLGVLVIIFQHGVGAGLLGFTSQGMVNVITPAILYVVLFALSTDYEVFLLSRVKESFEESGDNQESVAIGLSRTGGVITAAGLILIGTFGSFATAEIVTLKEIGLGLAIGVLIDSTLVRIVMVPATMKLLGNWNWWMPEGLKRFVPELREGPAPHSPPRRQEPGPAVAASRATASLLPGEGE